MVLGALVWIMLILKISKLQLCARCVYYLSEITTHTSNLKKYRTRTHRLSTSNDVEGIDKCWLHHV